MNRQKFVSIKPVAKIVPKPKKVAKKKPLSKVVAMGQVWHSTHPATFFKNIDGKDVTHRYAIHIKYLHPMAGKWVCSVKYMVTGGACGANDMELEEEEITQFFERVS